MVNPSTSAPPVGAVLADRYELVRHIARGGMGDVFEGRDRLLQRSVAVKLYRATAPTDRSRFDAEVMTLAALNHPGLVQVFDAGEHHGEGFVVLELVDGPSLRAILAERGALPPPEVAGIGALLADALGYVHERGVVHRDVTPANVLCGPDRRPRLADFGIARLLDTTRITAVDTTIGTAAYMAPEQVEGSEVTPATDVYALGLVLREALTGRPAFDGVGHEVALARLTRDPDVRTGIPHTWQDLLGAMTAREPSERPTASEVEDRLRSLASSDAAVAAGASGAPTAAMTGLGAAAGAGALAAAAGSGAPARPMPRSGEVDGHAETQALPVGGGTEVMPVGLRPAPTTGTVAVPSARPVPPAARAASTGSRRALWLALAAIALVLLVGLATADDGFDVPNPTTTTAPVAVTAPVTTAPTTTTPPPTEKPDKGHGRDRGKHDDD